MTRAKDVSTVADDIWRLTRVFERIRAGVISDAQRSGEHTALMLLFPLVKEGPMRLGALADAVLSDASTVSRQVAVLVRDGLVERQADPADGRATLLVPTEAATRTVADKQAHRDAYLTGLFHEWKGADLHDLAVLLGRLTDLMERHKQQLDCGEATLPAALTS